MTDLYTLQVGSYIDKVAGDSDDDDEPAAAPKAVSEAAQEAAAEAALAEPAPAEKGAKQAPKKRFMDMGAMRKR